MAAFRKGWLYGNAPYTIELWLRPAQAPDGNLRRLFGRTTTKVGNEYDLLFYNEFVSESGLGFEEYNTSDDSTRETSYPNRPVPLLAWTYLAFTFDGATFTSYQNDKIGDTEPWSTPAPDDDAGPASFYVGAASNYPSFIFLGDIDEFAVYPTALDSATIVTHYLAGANAADASDAGGDR